MDSNSEFWRQLRSDFEQLPKVEYRLTWSSVPPFDFRTRRRGCSQWVWTQPSNLGLLARCDAIARRGALALGEESEDLWYDRLRVADFVTIDTGYGMGGGGATGIELTGVVEDSITLCHRLESRSGQIFSENQPVPMLLRSLGADFEDLKAVGSNLGASLAEGEWTFQLNPTGAIDWRGLRQRFEALAHRAESLISGQGGDGASARWLSRIRSCGCGFATVQARAGGDHGWIPHLFEASAQLCLQLVSDPGQQAPGSRTIQAGDNAQLPQPALSIAEDRNGQVDRFLQSLAPHLGGVPPRKNMIWRLAGHTSQTQFLRWCRGQDNVKGNHRQNGATQQDCVNFKRVLQMDPVLAVEDLEKRGLISQQAGADSLPRSSRGQNQR